LGHGRSARIARAAREHYSRVVSEPGTRVGLIIGGLLCLAGLAGPAIGDIALRWIGEAGYAVVFPIVWLLLALHFRQIGSSLRASG
jgi:hypothetical protein